MSRIKRFKAILLTCTILLGIIIPACSKDLAKEEVIEVELRVTRNLGKTVIFDELLTVDADSSVIDILIDNLDVKTEHGGGFIRSIEGLESGFIDSAKGNKSRIDWFYFVNGISSNIGAGDYVLASGDIVWWDYHQWDGAGFTPAVSGCFPQPFKSGFRGTRGNCVVLYGEGLEHEAQKLKGYMQELGVEQIAIDKLNEEMLREKDGMNIVLEVNDKIAASAFWQDIMEHREKTGWLAKIYSDGIIGFDISGEYSKSFDEKVGAVLVSGQGMGDPYPLWLISANDQGTLGQLIDGIIDNPENLKNNAGVIYHFGEFIPLPLR
ncbi:MAG: DUF4430 domain-containing protein [Clostridiales bacterium]|nr:DUF4430 domain-containing protein [Clostridiales bacterium]